MSNSNSQRTAIEGTARERGLTNLTVITADMNDFQPDRTLRPCRIGGDVRAHVQLAGAAGAGARLADARTGRLFIHIFTHRDTPYRFDMTDKDDWIAQHFFTGGIMPSHGLIRRFPELFEVEAEWRWSGEHYRRTALDWLSNFDRHAAGDRRRSCAMSTGRDAALWKRRWRMFFLATAGLFGDSRGAVWGVSHYRLKPVHLAECPRDCLKS